MPDESTKTLSFGSEPYVEALRDRLRRHFADGGENPAFVAGIFGEWGCGKTRWLQRLEQLLEAAPAEDAITIPVFFNAWRYEREEHLVIPLLKTAQRAVEKAAERPGQPETLPEQAKAAAKTAWGFLRDRAGMLKDCALAIACGFSGKAKIPFLAEVSFSLKDMLAADRANQERRKEADAESDPLDQPLGKYASIYYDFQEHLRKVTGRAGATDAPKLNLVFLIDDLDRCLPEKAVEMLEAIKLFFEVDGCAFVLGLDEEIVSRGILHRYRDYAFEAKNLSDGKVPVQPITGHEYLEKMVHLPIRVPAVAARDAESFLLTHYRRLFEKRKAPDALGTERAGRADALERARPQEPAAPEIDRELLDLFLTAVPHVPRKLVRVAELFDLHLSIAAAKGLMLRPDVLLRLVILQLFAPGIYRFGRRHPAFFSFMIRWRQTLGQDWLVDANLDRHLEVPVKSGEENEKFFKVPSFGRNYAHDHIEVPLWNLIRECAHNRSGFDPRRLVKEGDTEEFPSLQPYFTFVAHVEGNVSPTSSPDAKPAGQSHDTASAFDEELPSARISDVPGFLAQICSPDPLQWRNALEQNADELRGRVLGADLFGEIERRVGERQELVSVPWVETLFPFLTADQLQRLYRGSNLLGRLSARPKGKI